MASNTCSDRDCQADKVSRSTARWWIRLLSVPLVFVSAALLYVWADGRSLSYIYANKTELIELDKRVQLREITANHILETLRALRESQEKMQVSIAENTKLLMRLNGIRHETR